MKDPEILQGLLDALDITANKLSKELDYASHQSVYHILNEVNALSDGIISRIADRYPHVNLNYLRTGESPILLNEQEARAQANVLNKPYKQDNEALDAFGKFLGVPEQLDRIEKSMQQILEIIEHKKSPD